MSLNSGHKLGSFNIIRLLGKGGMGEVYLARDEKLGRQVALKLLPKALAEDPERLARFAREAQTLASLNHTNVATVHGFEHDTASDTRFLIMEFIDGATLGERIVSRSLELRELLDVFVQFARGLDAAHDLGIVHRDLKPDNVKIAADGTVKVIDFGIAKNRGGTGDFSADAPTTPMSPVAVTAEGTFMGTPVYMSPEQARGQELDKRTDIWSFGCCLYEALTGRLPFAGDTVADTVGNILKSDPDWSRIPKDTPRELGRILRRCLEKDVRRRLSSAADCAIALEDLLSDLREGRLSTSVTSTPPSAAVATSPIRSLAVLPFENLMGDKEQQYLVDGMTEALTSELSKIKEIKVISRSSALRYRKTEKSAPQIAQELGVDGLVQGSIFRAGDDIRISAQLVDGRSDTQAWSDNFTGSFDDMLKLQNDVTFAIAKVMQVTVSPEEKKRISKRRTTTREVEKTLWEASYEFNKHSAEGYKRAIALYKRAIELDPEYPMSYVGLCAAYWVPSLLGGVRAREALVAAQDAAQKAIKLDEDFAGGHMSMGYVRMTLHHDWEGARKSFERSIELYPSYGEAHSGLALLYLALTDHEDAEREILKALELDPLSIMYMNNLGLIYVQMGRYEEAIQHLEKAVEINPMFVVARQNLSIAYHRAGRTHEAITLLESSDPSALKLPLTQAWLAYFYRELGDVKKAHAIVRERFGAVDDQYLLPLASAVAYSVIGDVDRVAQEISQSIEDREWMVLFIANRWFQEVIDFGDRYAQMLEKLHLPERVRSKAVAREQARKREALSVQPSVSSSFRWKPALAIGVVGIVLGALFGMSMGGGPGDGRDSAVAEVRIDSIAVLPLDNLKGDPTEDYFVDGMTEAITNELSKISSLKVISRTSTARYKGGNTPMPEIADVLGVQGLIEGTVLRDGDDVKITVRLYNGRTEDQLWQSDYTEPVTSVLQLHARVALDIASQIRATVEADERAQIADKRNVDPKANDAYLKALHAYRQQTREGLHESVAYLDEATAQDSNFAEAWAFIPRVVGDIAGWGWGSGQETNPKSKAAAERALALDPDLALAHYGMGTALWHMDWDWAGAEREFQRAIEIAPQDGELRYNYGWLLITSGREEQAIHQFSEGLKNSPLSPTLRYSRGYAMVNAGRYEEAIDVAEEMLDVKPDFGPALLTKGRALLELGNTEDAVEIISKAADLLDSDTVDARLAVGYVRLGDTGRAQQILAEMLENPGNRFQQDIHIAVIYAHLNDFDKAFQHLQKAIDERHWSVLEMRTDPVLEPLRSDSRYWELVEQIGYPPLPVTHPVYEQQLSYLVEKRAKELAAGQSGSGPEIKSLAVLPFENYSGDPTLEYRSDGMTDTLTSELAKIGSLTIKSRTSSMQYKNTDKPFKQVAGELGVDGLIEGSIQMDETYIIITARLIDGKTGDNVWGQTFNGTVENVLRLQGEVALAIAEELDAVLTAEETAAFTKAENVNPEAWDLYLKGVDAWRERPGGTVDAAIAPLERAIEISPEFSEAIALLAMVYNIRAVYKVDPGDDWNQSRSLAERAYALNPRSVFANLGMARFAMTSVYDWTSDIQYIERALQIDPSNSYTYVRKSIYYRYMGRYRDALTVLRIAEELDPLAPVASSEILRVLYQMGDYEAVVFEGEQAREQFPGYWPINNWLALAYGQLGRTDEALALIPEARDPNVAEFDMNEVLILAACGRVEEVKASMEKVDYEPVGQRLMPALIALGRVDEAFDYMTKLESREDAYARSGLSAIQLQPLWSDDRFWASYERMGLPGLPQEHPAYESQQRYLITKRAEELIAERGLVPTEAQ